MFGAVPFGRGAAMEGALPALAPELGSVAAEATKAGGVRSHATWSPYDNNGGTCVAVAGADFCVVAADTRLSTGFNIMTRDNSKLNKLTSKCVLAASGFQADIVQLTKVLQTRAKLYEADHQKEMSISAMSQLLGNTLYYKRFFPYYAFCICAGLDSEGKGCVYNYDAIGSKERTGYFATGSGAGLIMPTLDNQLKSPSPLALPLQSSVTSLTEAEVIDLVKDCFASAGERDIYTGDRVEIHIFNKDGVRVEYMDLKLD